MMAKTSILIAALLAFAAPALAQEDEDDSTPVFDENADPFEDEQDPFEENSAADDRAFEQAADQAAGSSTGSGGKSAASPPVAEKPAEKKAPGPEAIALLGVLGAAALVAHRRRR
jgi:MYXO-CTERM domain-containing protein